MTDLRMTRIDGGQGTLEGKSLDAFKATLRGPLLSIGDPGYDDVRQIWNGMMDKRPALIARCQGTADVIDAVGFARDNGILLGREGRRTQRRRKFLMRRRIDDRPVAHECRARGRPSRHR